MGLAWKSAVKINEKLVNQKYATYTVLILDAFYQHPRIWKAVYSADKFHLIQLETKIDILLHRPQKSSIKNGFTKKNNFKKNSLRGLL